MPTPVKRVLLMTGELTFRGSSILALRLANQLVEHDVEVVVLCARRGRLDPELTGRVRIVDLPGYGVPLWGRIVTRTVLHNLSDQPPDIIHVVGTQLLPQATRLAQRLDCPLVLGLTGQMEAQRLILSVSSPCRAIVCVSESVREALPDRLSGIERRVILPGVPLNTEMPEEVLAHGHAPVLGIAGPLEVLKGGSFFLRACHRVIEAGKQIRIVVTGSGPEEKNLRRLATSLELDQHITFVDDGTAMSTYLTALDIFCLPSLQQGFGVIMLEAMALGRPAIASGVGGILSIIEQGTNGLVVPPSDSRALADSMLQLLNNPSATRQMAVAGRNLVEDRFTADRMALETLGLYNDVAAPSVPETASIPISNASGE